MHTYRYTDKITCPYCGYEDIDSWEFAENNGNYTCSDCGKDFFVERDVEVTYSSFPIEINNSVVSELSKLIENTHAQVIGQEVVVMYDFNYYEGVVTGYENITYEDGGTAYLYNVEFTPKNSISKIVQQYHETQVKF
jgi:DNA-directed RNA polymerase subunit RPC12/RpoP